jgi:transposase
MTKQHSEDYKISAVIYYSKIRSLRKTCEIFRCCKSSLQRWVERYYETGDVKRKDYSERDSIITRDILNFIKSEIDNNSTITLAKLKKKIIKKFDVEISKPYIYYIITTKLNYSSKQVRKKYYPENKLKTLKQDKIEFYKKVLDIGIKNIICIDESGFYLNMTKHIGKSKKGKRVYKTTHIYPFKKYNFICAIMYGKVIGYKLYKDLKGGIRGKQFNDFINEEIKGKYSGKYILMDNAQFHKSKEVQENIKRTKNNFIYSIAYNPATNPIENLFSQLKSYVRNDSPQTFEALEKSIDKTFRKYIKKEHIENYFKYMFLQGKEFIKKHDK